ncbi:MAG: hypothetical protein K6F91_00625 [Ruminococcus sp.]|nr:hypothetical protein [Ruminococcus sp.]
MREGKPFERLMAANKGWEGAVKLGTESLGTSYKLERKYNNNVKAERGHKEYEQKDRSQGRSLHSR